MSMGPWDDWDQEEPVRERKREKDPKYGWGAEASDLDRWFWGAVNKGATKAMETGEDPEGISFDPDIYDDWEDVWNTSGVKLGWWPEDLFGGGGGGGGPRMPNFNLMRSPRISIPGAPKLALPAFVAPTLVEAMNEPGYAFRSKEGQNALERSAAARGLLRTGGTLKDLIDYSQNFASQEYQNVFDRALKGYGANTSKLQAEFDPQMAEWNAKAQAEVRRAIAEFEANNQWNMWLGTMWDKYNDPGLPPAV